MKTFSWIVSSSLAALLSLPVALSAQDATQAPAGGIVSLDDAPLKVLREHIAIQPARVFVDYTFRNDTARPISTTLAFIVPDYTIDFHRDEQGREAFDDVSFQIDGRPVTFRTEVRASLHGEDITSLLQQEHIDIASFGHFEGKKTDLYGLSERKLNHLVEAGVYVRAAKLDQDPLPRWTVVKRYVYQQYFPVGVPVRVQLSYLPVPGEVNSLRYRSMLRNVSYGAIDGDSMMELRRVCAGPTLQGLVRNYMAVAPHNAALSYVDFSLIGDHAWKGPVADFALHIDSPADTADTAYAPSVCWTESEPRVGKTVWSASASNFLPNRNVRVGWVQFESSQF